MSTGRTLDKAVRATDSFLDLMESIDRFQKEAKIILNDKTHTYQQKDSALGEWYRRCDKIIDDDYKNAKKYLETYYKKFDKELFEQSKNK